MGLLDFRSACNELEQKLLTEREGSVQLTSLSKPFLHKGKKVLLIQSSSNKHVGTKRSVGHILPFK